ncbi:hypothetical protein CLV93_105174 [Prolixibacter denitrificans]|uniref:Uncharacterized protein n=1 Tax=Prolixibacter denitrificans TaxID=1541063 RepID=A0A2P8CCX7_9BACT|nr:hypothetical protein CLV93_105174 [Prolixibacter denitrificans]
MLNGASRLSMHFKFCPDGSGINAELSFEVFGKKGLARISSTDVRGLALILQCARITGGVKAQ